MPQDNLQLNERDEVQQILGNPPGWILQWGITVVAISVTFFIILSWLIKYPDIIEAPVQLLTDNPPIRVVAKGNGEIDSLAVTDHAFIKENDLIAILRNPANKEDVLKVEKLMLQIEKAPNYQALYQINLPNQPNLGAIQNSYAMFAQDYNNFIYLTKQPTAIYNTNAIQEQITSTKKLIEAQKAQISTMKKEIKVYEGEVERAKSLLKDGAGSERELKQAEAIHLQYERQLKNAETAVINSQISIDQLKVKILDFKQNKNDQDLTGFTKIQKNARNIYGEIQRWKEQFLLIAPIDGQVSMAQFWSPNQFVKAGDEVLTIVPDAKLDSIVGKAFLPTSRAGKVDTSTYANIRFAGYPYQEYGVVRARISRISLVPTKTENGSFYPIELELPQKLMTTYNKEVEFSQEMEGMAHIVTEERRIIHRIFDKFNSMVRN